MGEIVSVQRRELNGLATGALVTGAAGLVAVAVAVIVHPFGGGNGDGEPPPDELLHLDILSIPFGR